MPSSVKAYSISISNPTTVAPGDGFIDNLRVEDYGALPGSVTSDEAEAKRRANWRYRNIIYQLGMVTNCYVDANSLPTVDNPAAGASMTAEASTFAFQIYVEHGDASLITEDELNAGTMLTGIDCITRCVSRALVADEVKTLDVYDPTAAQAVGAYHSASAVPRVGTRIETDFEIGAVAADLTTADALTTVIDLLG